MEEKNKQEKPQNKFLNEMYDDFFWLISNDPDKYDLIKNKRKIEKQLEENHEKINQLGFRSRDEYLKALEERERNSQIQKNAIPEIVVKESSQEKKQEVVEITEEEKETKLQEFFARVDEAHLTDDSKTVLKKMIDYAKKYNTGIVKNYIPFNMRIYTDDDETLYSIVNIIIDSFTFFGYMKNDEAVERSFYVIEEGNHITDLYNKHNSLIIFKDTDGLLNRDKQTRDKLLSIWQDTIKDYSNLEGITTIISSKDKEKIDELFGNNTTLKDKIFDFELTSTKSSTQEVYQSVLNNLKEHYTISGEFNVKLLDYITETFAKSSLTAPEYTNALTEKILFNQTGTVIDANSIPEYEKTKTIDEIFEDLNNLVGLDNVKEMLKDLVSLMKFKSKAGDTVSIKDTNLHMVFLGNPGTGKTTVARMVAGILYNLKYIDQDKLIEVSAKDLIGQYVGQTAPKTIAVVERALGGVLFIDEAYSLASKPGASGNSFNEECIATLIQAMENYRDNLVVIFAGYSKEMDAFLKSNSGIVSRIGYTMDFKDYTLDELILILKSMFKKAGFSVEKAAIEKAKTIISEYQGTEGFGNARFVRNLYEKAIIEHATNTQDTESKKALKTITAKDITAKNILKL